MVGFFPSFYGEPAGLSYLGLLFVRFYDMLNVKGWKGATRVGLFRLAFCWLFVDVAHCGVCAVD